MQRDKSSWLVVKIYASHESTLNLTHKITSVRIYRTWCQHIWKVLLKKSVAIKHDL